MSITPLPSPPLVTDNTATFNAKAFAFAAALQQFGSDLNAEIPAIDGAYPASLVSIGSANYKGDWSTLTGALNIPASCSYGNRIWLLTSNLANVAAAQPGVSSSWLDITPTKGGFKNRVINGGFTINQRGYSSGVAKGAGVYMHDRWKSGASGCTYTFGAASAGVPVQITITAGSLQQVIEGCHLPEGGTYTLSWPGTAQGKVAGGSYAASPIVVTGLTAGANCTVEFNTGTVGLVQLEPGVLQTAFDYRDLGRELAMCQRYFEKSYQLSSAPGSSVGWAGMLWASNGGAADMYCLVTATFKVQKRTTPTITYWDSAGNSSRSSIVSGGALVQTNNASLVNSFNANDSQVTMAILTNAQYNAGSAWAASAEL